MASQVFEMSGQENKQQKWAVLIGIEHYGTAQQPLANPRYDCLGNEIRYSSLKGCVNDVLAVEEYLVDTIKIEPDKIKRLIAPTPNRRYISELPKEYLEPTYANIIRSLQKPDGAKQGDLMYIHFSGHGGRATTIFDRSLKPSGLDEALVPTDIACGGKYVRDLELGMLLQNLENAGLTVTVVLDCCHSGGAVRGEHNSQLGDPRSIMEVYRSEPKLDKPRSFKRIQKFGRGVMLPRPRNASGAVVLAACLETQLAREKVYGHHTYGLLTYCLLDTLKNIHRDISTETLYHRIRASVQNSNQHQMPYLVGSEGRFFFSEALGYKICPLSIVSTSVDISKSVHDRFVRLGGGELHGVKMQSRYAILPYGFNFVQGFDKSDVLAQVRVWSVTDGESEALVEAMDDARYKQVTVGCPAILQELPDCEKFTVSFVGKHDTEGCRIEDLEKSWHEQEGNKTWLSLRSHDEAASFVVAVDADENFEIRHAPGNFKDTPWDNLEPLPVHTSMPELLRQLEHIARFTVIKELGTLPGAALPRKRLVSVEVCKAASDKPGPYGRRIPPTELTMLGGQAYEHAYEVEERTNFTITVKNQSPRPLGCVILNCASDFSVDRVFPMNEPFRTLEVNQPKPTWTMLSMAISKNQLDSAKAGKAVIDTLKVVVCCPEMGMNSLRLPGLFEASSGRAGQISSLNGLRELLRDLDMTRPAHVVRDCTTEFDNWETTDIKMRIRPSEHGSFPVVA